jgi:hypothetical protein
MTYEELLQRKIKRPRAHGFDPSGINAKLFDWQRVLVEWAVRQGRAALFEDCGLGKTAQQLEWANQVQKHTGGIVLVLAPTMFASFYVSYRDVFVSNHPRA